MHTPSSDPLQAIRPQEKEYQKEIRTTYQNTAAQFVTHSSDLLNLAVEEREHEGTPYQCLVSRCTFQKFDILAEVRGSIISYARLKQVVQDGRVDPLRLPVLLYLNHQSQLLLSPKNITRYLFTIPAPRIKQLGANCFIENHFGSKLLVMANRDIAPGEELVLEQRSMATRYTYSPTEF